MEKLLKELEEISNNNSNKIIMVLNKDIFDNETIENLNIRGNIEIIQNNEIDKIIKGVLLELGMPSHMQGYYYINEAIKLCLKNRRNKIHPLYDIYNRLTKFYNVKRHMIEKSIRDAITVTWDRGNFDFQNKLFGYTIDRNKGKPTNSEFIAHITNYIYLI